MDNRPKDKNSIRIVARMTPENAARIKQTIEAQLPEELLSPLTVLVVRDLELDDHEPSLCESLSRRIGWTVVATVALDRAESTPIAAEETEKLRGIFRMLGEHYPPQPLPALDPNDPAAVSAWCRQRLQELQRLLTDATRETLASFVAPPATADDYCLVASNHLRRVATLASDYVDTLGAVSMWPDNEDTA